MHRFRITVGMLIVVLTLLSCGREEKRQHQFIDGCVTMPLEVQVADKKLSPDDYYVIQQIENLFRLPGGLGDAIRSSANPPKNDLAVAALAEQISPCLHITTKGMSGLFYLQCSLSATNALAIAQILTSLVSTQSESTNYTIFTSFLSQPQKLSINPVHETH